MFNNHKIIAVIAIFVGFLFGVIGLAGIGLYIYSFLASINEPDKSAIFWFLPFFFGGILFLGIGICFLFIGKKTYEESERYLKLTKISLSIFIIIFGVLLITGYLNEINRGKESARRDVQQQDFIYNNQNSHKLEELEASHDDLRGIKFITRTSGNIQGEYLLKTKIYNDQAIFLESAEPIYINSNTEVISKEITFTTLFRKCFNTMNNSNIYVCTKNAGTSNSRFTIELMLSLSLNDTNGELETVQSTKKTYFYLDTYTDSNNVKVNKITYEK